MSLKTFHTLFIIIAILADFGYMAYLSHYASDALREQAGPTAILSGILGTALLIYLPIHIWKSRKIIV